MTTTRQSKETSRQRKKRFKARHQRRYRQKLARLRALQQRNIVYHIIQAIYTCMPDLFDRLRDIDDVRKKASEYEQAELLTACLAMFLFKEGSRNAMNNDREEATFRKNYETLFKMRLPHMDTVDVVMRRLEPSELEALKRSLVRGLLARRTLHKFRLFDTWCVVAVDATGVVSFSERHCEHCLTTTSKTGKVTYFHTVLEAKLICANGFSLSLETEWIENPVGDFTKQDCERKAFKRLAARLKRHFPRLPICLTADGLYPNAPFFDICRDYDWRFIVTFKDGNLPTVWDAVFDRQCTGEALSCEERVQQGETQYYRLYRWVTTLMYHGHQMQWFECYELRHRAKEKVSGHHFVFVSDLPVEAETVAELVRTGRLRWKIENEGFNTQKNLGYNLQHKYSRCSGQAGKNYYQCLQIAHLINQLAELNEQAKRLLLSGKKTLKSLWKRLFSLLLEGLIAPTDIRFLETLRSTMRYE
jgi:hypothetical protein